MKPQGELLEMRHNGWFVLPEGVVFKDFNDKMLIKVEAYSGVYSLGYGKLLVSQNVYAVGEQGDKIYKKKYDVEVEYNDCDKPYYTLYVWQNNLIRIRLIPLDIDPDMKKMLDSNDPESYSIAYDLIQANIKQFYLQ